MKFCNDCNMKIDSNKSYCPLCGDMLEVIDDKECLTFPEAKVYQGKQRLAFLSKLFFALSIFAAVVCVVINIATYKIAPLRWSGVAAVGILYCWHLVRRCILQKGNATKVLFKQMLTISILLFCIDYFLTGFSGWSICYAIPFMSISISITIMIIALANMLYYRDHLHYSLATLAISALQLLSLFFVQTNWAIIASGLFAIAAIVVICSVAQKSVQGELRKRLHL